MIRKNGRLLVLPMLCTGLLLSACGGKDAAGPNQGGAKPANEEPANLVVYSNSGDSLESWNERFGDALKAKFPHYTIKYIQKQKDYGMKEVLTAGEKIDIYWDSIGGFAAGLLDNGLEFDMTELAKTHGIAFDRIEPTVADSVKQISPDKLYGIPVFNNNMVLYYNKDLFDKFGIPYPKDGMTWTEANATAVKLTRFDQNQFLGLSSSQTHMLMMNQLSLPFVDPTTEKATLLANDQWKTFFETVFISPSKATGYTEYMKANKETIPYKDEFLVHRNLAMFAWLSSIVFVYPEEFKQMNWDMVSLPTFESKPGIGSQPYPTYFAVTSVSKQKEQAMNVIAYLLSDEVQTKLSQQGVMPVVSKQEIKQAYGQESMFKDKNLKAAFYNKFAPIPFKSRYDSLLLTPYAKTVPKVILTGDYNTIFRATEEDTNKKIEAAKAQ